MFLLWPNAKFSYRLIITSVLVITTFSLNGGYVEKIERVCGCMHHDNDSIINLIINKLLVSYALY